MTTVSRKRYKRDVLLLAIFAGIMTLLLLVLYLTTQNGTYQKQPPEEPVTSSATSTYLRAQESVKVASSTTTQTEALLPVVPVLFEYIEVIDGCGPHFDTSECLNVRSGPGIEYDVVTKLRNGVVLKVGGQVERDGSLWYKIVFDEWLRYPERVSSDWYIAANYVRVLMDEGVKTSWENEVASSSQKRIVVNRTTQTLTAYVGDDVFLENKISTGLELHPTPRGSFTIFKKMPSRYMQGPLPGFPATDTYDLPGVPWNLYFTEGGAVIHGAYWHTSFGFAYSHGCVNVPVAVAETLYRWAELGTIVEVMD